MPTPSSAGPGRCSTTTTLPTIRSAFAAARCGPWRPPSAASAHLGLADSLGIDFHKTGFAPYISSLFLLRDRADFGTLVRAARDDAVPLSHGRVSSRACSRWKRRAAPPASMAALANLLLLGKDGLRTLIGHAVEMAEVLRELIVSRPELTVVNDDNFGPVTLFRVYPAGVDTFRVQSASRPRLLIGAIASAQRAEPPHLPAGRRRGACRPRRRHRLHRQLPAFRLRRADLGPQVVRPLPLRRRRADARGHRLTSWRHCEGLSKAKR